MLFNSIEFIFVFLPVVVLVCLALRRGQGNMGILWLGVVSVAFYSWWDPKYVLLLLASIVFNFLVGRQIARRRSAALLTFGVAVDLALLGWYKYAGFFADNLGRALGVDLGLSAIILPLGISFFTFTQIAFLVDAYRGEAAEYSFPKYLLFATFFPHVIAGPILHHRDIIPQFDHWEMNWHKAAQGLALFAIGLVKKVMLADGVAPYASEIFEAARNGPVSFFEAWQGALAYTLQLYFDFSGYCDMALGAALLIGISMPLNFDSPYKATSIIEFWRRWHMTLSRFLRDYLYFPLGGNRHGAARRCLNLMVVMLLGGFWHGAGWTFIAWGALHGLYLLINHVWRSAFPLSAQPSLARRGMGWVLTFAAVVCAWVFFRADSISTALTILHGLSGQEGIALGLNHRHYLGGLAPWLEARGWVTFVANTHFSLLGVAWIGGAMALAVAAPNSQELVLRLRGITVTRGAFAPLAGAAFGLLAACAVAWMGEASEFLYFNF